MKTPFDYVRVTGDEVRRYREAAGLSQTELAVMLGIYCEGARAIVSKIENGKRSLKGPIAKLLRAYIDGSLIVACPRCRYPQKALKSS